MQQPPRCLPPIYVFPRLRQLFMEGSSTRLVGANARRDIDTLAANTPQNTACGCHDDRGLCRVAQVNGLVPLGVNERRLLRTSMGGVSLALSPQQASSRRAAYLGTTR